MIISRYHFNQLRDTYRIAPTKNSLHETHQFNGRKQLVMRDNNLVGREEPLYEYMRFDTYDKDQKINEVRMNRQMKLKQALIAKDYCSAVESMILHDPLIREREKR